MAIIQVDPAAGALAQAFAKVGEAAANRLNEKKIRLKQLKENPQVLAQLAPAYRQALRAGQVDAFFDSLGVDRTDAEPMIAAYQPTPQELRDIAEVEQGLPGKQVRAAATQADVTSATGQAAFSSGLIQAQNDAALAEAAYSSKSFDELTKANIPQLVADAERADALLKARGSEVNRQALNRYVEGINSIDQSTPEGKDLAFRANAYLSNPGFAGYLAQKDELDLRARLAIQANQPTPQETVQLGLDIQDKMEARLKTLNDLRESGAPKDEIEAAGQALNNIANLARDLSNAGVIMPIDVTSYEVESKLLTPENFTSNFARASASAFTEALEGTTDEKILEVEETIASLDEVARQNNYSSVDKREIGRYLTSLLTTLREQKRVERMSATRQSSEETKANVGRWIEQLNADDAYEARLKLQLSSPRGGGLR